MSMHVILQHLRWHLSAHDYYFYDCQVKSDIFPIDKGKPRSEPQLLVLSYSHVARSLICSLPSVATCCIYASDGPGLILLI